MKHLKYHTKVHCCPNCQTFILLFIYSTTKTSLIALWLNLRSKPTISFVFTLFSHHVSVAKSRWTKRRFIHITLPKYNILVRNLRWQRLWLKLICKMTIMYNLRPVSGLFRCRRLWYPFPGTTILRGFHAIALIQIILWIWPALYFLSFFAHIINRIRSWLGN